MGGGGQNPLDGSLPTPKEAVENFLSEKKKKTGASLGRG